METIKKIIILVLIIFLNVFCISTIYNDYELIKKNIINEINENILTIGNYARNISVFDKSGTLSLVASYKGAHGESNPHDFSYSFNSSNNNIFITNEDGINSYNISSITNIINRISSLKEFAPELIIEEKIQNNKIIYTIDKYLINEIYDTNFNNISIEVNTIGLIKKIKNYQIKIDDYIIKKESNKLIIENDLNKVTLSFGNNGYSLNINDKLKINVVDFYQYNININGTSFFLELTDVGFYLTALTSHAIYNSLEIEANYEDIEEIENKEINLNSPINRYFSEIDFNIWEY